MPVKLAVISDSPKIHTGFSVVVREVVKRLHASGKYLIRQYGLLDNMPDHDGVVPWSFIPTPTLDDLGHATYTSFIRAFKPDVVLIIQPPSNARRYNRILTEDCAINGKNPKIVLYTPIEGDPITRDTIEGLQMADAVVAYANYGQRIIEEQAGVKSTVAFHGGDHENWCRYSSEARLKIKKLVGWDDRFVVGSVGVNKRTKGHVETLQVARILKDRGRDDILFYLHTHPDRQTMLGYDLRQLAIHYDVVGMVQWRLVFDEMSYWIGHAATNMTFHELETADLPVPETSQQRGLLFASFDMRTIFNSFDLYLDLSQNEGWGLPLHEAMACGVPSITINDHAVRKDIWSADGPYFIEPIPKRMWHTLHTGAKLPTVDPEVVADAIEYFADNPGALADLSNRCLTEAGRYKWDDCAAVIDKAISTVLV